MHRADARGQKDFTAASLHPSKTTSLFHNYTWNENKLLPHIIKCSTWKCEKQLFFFMMSFLSERLFIIVSLSATTAVNWDHKWRFLVSQLFAFPFSPTKRLQNLMYRHYVRQYESFQSTDILEHTENTSEAKQWILMQSTLFSTLQC